MTVGRELAAAFMGFTRKLGAPSRTQLRGSGVGGRRLPDSLDSDNLLLFARGVGQTLPSLLNRTCLVRILGDGRCPVRPTAHRNQKHGKALLGVLKGDDR